MTTFAQQVLTWYAAHGRKDLPWQQNTTPYRVWISEIMLQQTQVSAVIPYYLQFMAAFPDIATLARANVDHVLHHWSGLGYYARARNLHKAAQYIAEQHGGVFPNQFDAIIALPGIGRSTAGAILALAFQQCYAILDGNVKRVLSRYHAVCGWPGKPVVAQTLWQFSEQHTPENNIAQYTQAMMDLGATLCVRSSPQCVVCPLVDACQAHQQGCPTDFPHKKPKTQKPSKSTRFLIILNQEGVPLLTRRPDKGIWGGLWCFPECPEAQDPIRWCQQNLDYSTAHIKDLPSFEHIFTHFKLTIHPTVLRCANGAPSASDRCWHHPESSQTMGFPAPVQQLLTRLFPQNSRESIDLSVL